MNKIKLNVHGMHCKSCEMLIQDNIMDAGAESVIANNKKGVVEVTFSEGKLDEKKIKSIIHELGFKVI